MINKRIAIIGIMAVIGMTFIVSSADAGSRNRRHRHMLQGAAIGIGAFMIGKAIHDQIHHRPLEAHLPVEHYSPPPYRDCGYWEVRRVWVPPTYRQVWNPGHYDRRNRWVPGRYIEIVDRPGYWDERRVWVASR